jgi:hypothetical protein
MRPFSITLFATAGDPEGTWIRFGITNGRKLI